MIHSCIVPAPLAGGTITISKCGSEERRRAATEYMQFSFEEAGVQAHIIEFSSLDRRVYNVEATLEGSLAGTGDKKHLWLAARVDCVYNARVNDDASGLVSIFAAARALKQIDPKYTVHFVAYDPEEF